MTAYARLVRRTPLVPAPSLGANVWLKLECLQRTGSFKLRGACVRLDAMSPEDRARGVVAASAGNHGQGVAAAGRVLGVAVEVVVPSSTPAVKRLGMEALGATVIVEGAGYDDAERFARARAAERGAVFVSPFDDALVIRGNGELLGEEILADRPSVRRVVCPVGGGGLVGGLAAALVPRGVEVVGVQPRSNCAMHDSLATGAALTRYEGGATLAEGCEGAVAERTYDLCRDHRVGIALVSEPQILQAMAVAYRSLGVVCEPSAAVALAGVLSGAVLADDELVVVVSGGNVDPDTLDRALGG